MAAARTDGTDEQVMIRPVGRRLLRTLWAVQSDGGVEVDQAALLVLGDLGEGDRTCLEKARRLIPAEMASS
ncbi:hypothetical protein GCM10009555_001810 [Acrocarpospora macrocephala]|uniref:Uncharacterized protein n=1 Tax=Acrocarpospora macrocephala TaxID=150177 RepID=A0A5M3X7G7_9ACTN|nr:hypothetical protein Amac_102200 [Acrocarpospora macrocephala]